MCVFVPILGQKKTTEVPKNVFFCPNCFGLQGREGKFFPNPVTCVTNSLNNFTCPRSVFRQFRDTEQSIVMHLHNSNSQICPTVIRNTQPCMNASAKKEFDLYFIQTMLHFLWPTRSGLVADILSIPIWWDQSLSEID